MSREPFFLDPHKLIAGKYFGQFQSIFAGAGNEINEVRSYSPGDPAKSINRKASAKHQHLYTTTYQSEKELHIDILRDVNYNRNGVLDQLPNYDRVRELMSDLVIFARRYGCLLTLRYPEVQGRLWKRVQLRHEVIGKHYDILWEQMESLPQLCAQSPRKYHSCLSEFLSQMETDGRRRALLVCSDFLEAGTKEAELLHYLQDQHMLALYRLPIGER